MSLLKIKKFFEYLLSFPKSLFFCLRCLPFNQAVFVPIFVRYNVKIRHVGKVKIVYPTGGGKMGLIRIGFGKVGIFDKKYERTIWDVNGDVIFHGFARIGNGSRIVVGSWGILSFGNNFECTAAASLICLKSISLGDNTLISWDTIIMDSDFHYIYDSNNKNDALRDKEIMIGNNVWIGCRVTILKGTSIASNSVVAGGSLVNKSFVEGNVLIAGIPAVITKHNICWEM